MYFHLKRAQSLFNKIYTCTGLFYILLQSTADELLFYTMCMGMFFSINGDVLTFLSLSGKL